MVEKNFYGYNDYWDWYDNGPGSEAWKRKGRAEQRKYQIEEFNRRQDELKEIKSLRKKVKEMEQK